MSIRVRLCIMMFLQFMVWGVWYINLGAYLGHLGFSGVEIGWVFLVFTLACLISPFIGGQIADRYLPTQVFLAICHLIGGVFLLYLSQIDTYGPMWVFLFIYSLFYAPTLALSNSICFHYLTDPKKEFGVIRAFGTLGWIAAGLLLSFWWSYVQPFSMTWEEISALQGAAQQTAKSDFLASESMLYFIAGVISIICGLYCLLLPNTPPSKENQSPFAFLDALKLFKDKDFAIFMVICFVVTTELMFFYILTPPFLASMRDSIAENRIPAILTIFAQGAEMLTLFVLLPFLLPRLGVTKTLAVGVIAWPIRYFVFCIGYPGWLVVASLTLHGICYVFFFIVGQIYVDTVAPKDIRASAQSLLTMITFGLGLTLGSYFVGWVKEIFTIGENLAYPELSSWKWLLVGWIRDNFSDLPETVTAGMVNYRGLFLVPCVLTVVCALAFLVFFKEPEKKENGKTASA